jgi:hypothetical protein
MDRTEVLRQFTEVLDDFIKQKAYGTIEVIIRDGCPMLLSTTVNRQLQPKGSTHGQRPEYRKS